MTHLHKLLVLTTVCLPFISVSHAQAPNDWAASAKIVFYEDIQAGKLTQEQATTYLVCASETMRKYNTTEPFVQDFNTKLLTWMAAVSDDETRPSAAETREMVSELNQMVPKINAYMDKAEDQCRKQTGIPAEPGKALNRLNKIGR